MAPFGTLKAAGQFLFLSGILHIPALFLSGFAPVGWFMMGVAVFYIAVSAGLTRGLRWLGYVAFVCMLGGMAGAYIQVGTIPVPDWLIWTIIAVDALVLINLFVALWRPKDSAII